MKFPDVDPQSGGVDIAVNELDADRLVSGGHGPTPSFSTELAKVLDAMITHGERMKIFGENYRPMAKCIFKRKRLEIDI
ncbi:MAG: hypothetical protein IPL46_19255 [Saprospiraceae bacterium]|nr:hypothetical protein [Saprospiraceae bacterium]